MRNVDKNIEEKIFVSVKKKEKKKIQKENGQRNNYNDFIFEENGFSSNANQSVSSSIIDLYTKYGKS